MAAPRLDLDLPNSTPINLFSPPDTPAQTGTSTVFFTPTTASGGTSGVSTPASSTPTETSTRKEEDGFRSKFASPPGVKQPYDPAEALDDIPGISYALELFLASHMLESEEYCNRNDVTKERLYFSTGYGLIQCVKGLMSYEDNDLLAAIQHTKHGNHIASQHRKKHSFLGSILGSSGVDFIKSMTPVERHAELVYAESLYEKALLGIVYSGDWLAFIKEALNMRTTIQIYQLLFSYVTAADAAHPEGYDPSIDVHFRSGVYLGAGMCDIILSMIPGRLGTLVELFGYRGDRARGLGLLMRAGGGRGIRRVRRSICDMSLLIFHLILSSLHLKDLEWNLKRYPNGVFFLFGAGRLALVRSQPQRAIDYYTKAMHSQSQYRNLHHISWWEMSIAYLALWEVEKSMEWWKNLVQEATWSKSIYSYGLAVCLLQLGGEGQKKEAAKLMEKVPGLRQKIAGKSIPLEKFVARKARKFQSQGGRLALPVLELAYLFLGITHAPAEVITKKMLPELEALLAKLDEHKDKPSKYENGKTGFWDDFCLAKFLQGVCLRYVAYPYTQEEAEEGAVIAFKQVFEHGPKIELDHHIVYHAHYEYGRLLACQGDLDSARREFDLVLSGKPLEVGSSGRKGKYSMENALHMRTHAALDALHKKRL
ncbi:hypothetical protein BDQ17DRAFT_1402144 [Cyathus striatus]|nr:hypothetical protein BDQ17DRAFT_1402144 [Cyathus striatus]